VFAWTSTVVISVVSPAKFSFVCQIVV